MSLVCLAALLAVADESRMARVDVVRKTPGFAALWDFVLRDSQGRFDAWRPGAHKESGFGLDAVNYVRDYWGAGRAAAYADFPVHAEGPFGAAVEFRDETDPDFRPVLLVPRQRLHNSAIDVKGPGASVSMVVWLRRSSGNHAIAGIWHEGTDHVVANAPAVQRVEKGQRQYALFAGLAANNGASAAHVSENGAASFGDKYARNLAVTPQKIPTEAWASVAFTFDNKANTVTAYLNGEASPLWIDNPQDHPFFKWPARGWQNGEYQPPETKPRRVTVVSRSDAAGRVELREYEFTKVRVTLRNGVVTGRELVALRANPFWFPHDLFSPSSSSGGPFTIGRVIHMSRNVGFTGRIGGVAVFNRALSPKQMRRLGRLGLPPQ